MSTTSYQRHSAEFWEKTVAEFHQSTLSGAAFCKQQGIAYASFCKWRHKLQSSASQPEKPTAPTFIDLQSIAQSKKQPWRIVLKLDDGIELILSQG
jgi:transposase-like protein